MRWKIVLEDCLIDDGPIFSLQYSSSYKHTFCTVVGSGSDSYMTLMGFSILQRSKLQAKGDGESRPESQSASQPEGLSCSSICIIADDHHIWFEPCFGDSAVRSSRGKRLCHLIHFQSSFVLSSDACFRLWKTTHCKEGTICWGSAYWSRRCRSSTGCRDRDQIQVLDASHVLH